MPTTPTVSSRFADHPDISLRALAEAQRRATAPVRQAARMAAARERRSADEMLLQHRGRHAQLSRGATADSVTSAEYDAGTVMEVRCVEVARTSATFAFYVQRGFDRVDGTLQMREEPEGLDVVQHVEHSGAVDVAAREETKKRKFSRQVSDGAAGVREFGRKIRKKVSNVSPSISLVAAF